MEEYSFEAIGKQIAKERKQRKISQDGFIELLNQRGISIGRNRLSAIENGKDSSFSLNELFSICDIFQCDAGFLLGEYEEKTQDKHFIHQQTGLTETAIDFLRPHSQDWQTGVLSLLLEEYPDFVGVLASIYEYYGYYATAEKDKATFVRESYAARAELKGAGVNAWDKMLELASKQSVTNDKLERNNQLVKAQRLDVYEKFIAVVDKIVARQYKKHSK